jgi:hypothetical protein
MAAFGLDEPGALIDDHAQFYPENRWRQDRSLMSTSFSGLHGPGQEDAAVAASQGLIADRTREHLVPADIAIIRARRLVLDSIRQVQKGGNPHGLTFKTANPESEEGVLPVGAPWQSLVPGNIELPEAARRGH